MSESDRKMISVAFSGEPGLVEQVTQALTEVFERFGVEAPRDLGEVVGYWAQNGGWYQDVEGGWSQKGGWVEDLEGIVAMRAYGGRPTESIVRDVWAALDRVQPDPAWQQSWEPYPRPRPGLGPDIIAGTDGDPSSGRKLDHHDSGPRES
jgi:hypothetical protein